MRRRYALLVVACLVTTVRGQDASGFNGTWREDIREGSPTGKSKTPRELRITTNRDTLTVTMTGTGKIHSVDVTYQIDGPEVTYTGLDGDEFHIKVSRGANNFVFDGHERERGSDYPVHEVWTLKNKSEGQVLIVTKDQKGSDEPAKSVTEYERVPQ